MPGAVKVMSPKAAVPPVASGLVTASPPAAGMGASPTASSVKVNLPVMSGAFAPSGAARVFFTETLPFVGAAS